MFSITYNKDTQQITVRGRFIKKADAERLLAMGIDMKGVVRVITDANVISHNAQKVTRKGAVATYGWRINSVFDPAPKMVLTF